MNPETLRAEIPALEECVYLNTGASGPSPRPVVEAARHCLDDHEFRAPAGEGKYRAAMDCLDETRAAVARHLGGDPGDVALTASTGDGIGRIAAAVDWEPGDVVVRTDLEHPAGTLPWDRLARRHGVEVRVVESEDGRVDADEFAEAVEGARLACFSSVSWTAGTRLPVGELTRIAHDAGARVLVDAVQSVGQHPVDVAEWGADAVAASGHKWLLGTWGSGFLHVDPEFAATLHPAVVGYFGVEDAGAGEYELATGAGRLEVGTKSLAPYAALQAGIETIEAVGYDAITARVERLTDRLKAGLAADRIASPTGYESGLVAVEVDDAEATVERLKASDVVVRSIPGEAERVRVSVHVFNDADDVDALVEEIGGDG